MVHDRQSTFGVSLLHPQTSANPTTQKSSRTLASIVAVILSGLAAGAIWCLLSLTTQRDTAFLIIPLALSIAAFLRWQNYRGMHGMVCALAATALAFAYAQYLFAAVRVAQILGFSLRSTLFKMDFALAWQGACANLNAWAIVWFAVACVLAGLAMLRDTK